MNVSGSLSSWSRIIVMRLNAKLALSNLNKTSHYASATYAHRCPTIGRRPPPPEGPTVAPKTARHRAEIHPARPNGTKTSEPLLEISDYQGVTIAMRRFIKHS